MRALPKRLSKGSSTAGGILNLIISASRRTDIPAFFAQWFMARIREGSCETVNPFNPQQRGRVSLAPEDVEAIVFWSKNPRPLMPFLKELEQSGYRFCFTSP